MAFTVACPHCFKPNKYKGRATELPVECGGCKQTFVPTPDLHFGIRNRGKTGKTGRRLAILAGFLALLGVILYWAGPLVQQAWQDFSERSFR